MGTISKNRIEYIDLAKGFCILYVVVFHLMAYYGYTNAITNCGRVFRMPLYYFLSGLFFKRYGGFLDFSKRKINKLVVPFVFWYVVSITLSIVLYAAFGWKLSSVHRVEPIPALLQVFTYGEYPNIALWFLISLFESNIIFYIISLLADKMGRYQVHTLVVLTLLCGGIGLWLMASEIQLPLSLSKTLYSLPHFCLGYLIFRKTKILESNKFDSYCWVISIVAFSLLAPVAHWGLGLTDPKHNISGADQLILAYPGAWLGIISVISLAKSIKRLPVVSMYGRYSIMILVTHMLVYMIFRKILSEFGVPKPYSFALNLVVVLSYGLIFIPMLRRYFPHVTAQKDVIKVEDVS